jgi:hypothetical protein
MSEWVLLRSCRALAGRMSFRSLYRGHITSPADAVKGVLAVRKRWQWFVGQLAEAEWPPAFKSKLHAKYLAHCPVFGLSGAGPSRAPKSRACRRPLYCPFCYAREYAVAAYDRLVGLLPPDGERGKVVLCGTEKEYEIDPNAYPTAAGGYRAAQAVIRSLVRRTEVDAAKPIGAVVFHRVRFRVFYNAVLDRDEVTRLTVVRTALMVCNRARRLAVPGGATLSVAPDPRRYDLALEVGRLFRYPHDWYEAPVMVAAGIGRYLAAARVFAAYGAARRPKAEVVVSEDGGEETADEPETTT